MQLLHPKYTKINKLIIIIIGSKKEKGFWDRQIHTQARFVALDEQQESSERNVIY